MPPERKASDEQLIEFGASCRDQLCILEVRASVCRWLNSFRDNSRESTAKDILLNVTFTQSACGGHK